MKPLLLLALALAPMAVVAKTNCKRGQEYCADNLLELGTLRGAISNPNGPLLALQWPLFVL
jgi:hypothetical protein